MTHWIGLELNMKKDIQNQILLNYLKRQVSKKLKFLGRDHIGVQ